MPSKYVGSEKKNDRNPCLDKFSCFPCCVLGKVWFGCMFSKTGTLAASGDGASALTREVESVVGGREVIFDLHYVTN